MAVEDSDATLCDMPVRGLREYPLVFGAQEQRIRCPVCDERLGHPTR